MRSSLRVTDCRRAIGLASDVPLRRWCRRRRGEGRGVGGEASAEGLGEGRRQGQQQEQRHGQQPRQRQQCWLQIAHRPVHSRCAAACDAGSCGWVVCRGCDGTAAAAAACCAQMRGLRGEWRQMRGVAPTNVAAAACCGGPCVRGWVCAAPLAPPRQSLPRPACVSARRSGFAQCADGWRRGEARRGEACCTGLGFVCPIA